MAESGLNAADVKATGPGNRLLKEDVLRHIEARAEPPEGEPPDQLAVEAGAVDQDRTRPGHLAEPLLAVHAAVAAVAHAAER